MTTVNFTGSIHGAEKSAPFYPGEKLTFQVRWSFIPAGEAVLEVLPVETLNDIQSYHFRMTAKTYPFVDFFCKVRDRIDGYTDLGMTHSILYKKRNQGKTKRDVIVHFNWDKQEVNYSNFGRKRKSVLILPSSFDPLSVFYAFRRYALQDSTEIGVPVTDGKKCVMGKAKVIKRETVAVARGTYDTYLVEPELKHIGGVFEKSRDAKLQIWVTADSRKMPVRIKSKVVVGSFVAELISVETGDRIGAP